MRAAIGLARRHVGHTWPNPSVGCVIVADGRVVGRGVTQPGGRPHAETQAVAMAGEAARGATAYVTLEPCCFHGRTPPCTDALIAAGIARVVIATLDPDPRVNGAGIRRLIEAGMVVEQGMLAPEAEEVAAGLFHRIRLGRPLVTLKLATTLDGRIATRDGESQWITGPSARRQAHVLRGRADAVMVGVGTVLADDPLLTCRIDGFKPTQLIRVIADSRLRTPLTSQLVATARSHPTWIVTREDADKPRLQALRALGVSVIPAAGDDGGIDLARALRAMAGLGITRVLAEGGAALAASLLRADLVDRVAWFHAPGIMGSDGLAAAAALGLDRLADMTQFHRTATTALGEDMLTELRRTA